MIKIWLNGEKGKGLYALVDEDDYDKVSKTKWYLVNGYARSRGGVSMHRAIMSPPCDMVVDHKNHNKLDNRKCNLRICSQHENSKNRIHGKGYGWDKKGKCWRVRWGERIKGKKAWEESRRYKTEEEAKEAVKMLRSGVELPRKDKKDRMRHLPHHIRKNRLSGYGFYITISGKAYYKYGFDDVASAVKYRDDFIKKMGVVL